MKTTLLVGVVVCLFAASCATPVNLEEDPPVVKKDAGTVKWDSGSAEMKPDASMMQQEDQWSPPPDTGTQCTLGIAYGAPQCDGCMQNHCCTADNACVSDNDCINFLSCGNNCAGGDASDIQTCVNQCANTYPKGVQLFQNIVTCMQQYCANDCR